MCSRKRDQQNSLKCPEIILSVYDQLIFDKKAKNIQWRRKSLNKWCGNNWIFTCERINLDTYIKKVTKNGLKS